MVNRILLSIIICLNVSFAAFQTTDSLIHKIPSEAAKYALLFPGAGQFYNDNYIKGSVLLALEIYSIVKFNEYRLDVKCENLTSSISKRNKAAWWTFFIYFYGFMDAVVEAHLKTHQKVMETPIDKKD